MTEVRDRLSARDWRGAHATLAPVALDSGADADPALLDAFAEAAWWLGRLPECITARERAYNAFLEGGDRSAAARVAMLLSDHNGFQGRPGVAGAWLRRAERLLAEEGECLQHGCLVLRQGEAAHGSGDLDGALARFERAVGYGRRFGDADLEADGLQAMGRVLLTQGRRQEGMSHLDEAMLLAVEGRLGPFMTGKVYCSLMSACEEIGDLRRAAEWTEAGNRWADAQGDAVFPGLCRVHRAEVLQQRGAWPEAEREARRAVEELDAVHQANAAAGFYGIGEIRRRLGDLDGAAEAFARCEALGGDTQPGMALLQLSQGHVAAAAAAVARALAGQPWNRLARARLLPAQAHVAFVAGDAPAAERAAAELEETAASFDGGWLRASALCARGRAELAADRPSSACAVLTEAVRLWRELECPYEEATSRQLLGLVFRALGDEDGARGAFAAAAQVFARLGAAEDVRRTEALCATCAPVAAALPDGLTARECEVLRLVACGHTNRDIAQRLVLSEKTVARHLSNIFTKIGVSSRAAATAYAFTQGLAQPTG